MKLIVGLGNPGSEYRKTRHNIGFAVLDALAVRAHAEFDSAPVEALMARWRDRDAILAKPLTFMNNSGEAVGGLLRYFKIDVPDLLVVVDEVQLPLARLRARARGSAGGHNGLKSIIEQLGHQEFPRLRVGVGRGEARRDLADHVLSKFDPAERDTIQAAVLRAADATELFVADGIARVMNAFNAADNQQDPGE